MPADAAQYRKVIIVSGKAAFHTTNEADYNYTIKPHASPSGAVWLQGVTNFAHSTFDRLQQIAKL
jgi:hypothetical protein